MKYGLLLGAAIALYIAHAGTAHAERITLSNGITLNVEVVTGECSATDQRGCEFGSTEYCTYFFDRPDQTITFESVSALRACDTNDDGVYNYCDDYVPHKDGGYTFQDQWHYRMCEVYGHRDFNPIQNRIVDGG